MKKCLVISGGDFFDAPKSLYEDSDFTLACDKGFEYSKRLGFLPDLVIGDFDSSKKPLDDEFFSSKKVEIKILSPDKDDTDTMAGVKIALEKGCTDFTFICALGGRLDHIFSNIQTLSFIASKGGRARILSDSEEVYVLKGSSVSGGSCTSDGFEASNGGKIRLPKKNGWSLSVFSLSDCSEGVFEKGSRWTLSGATMKNDYPYGVSNEWVLESAEIGVEKGVILVILSKIF